MLKKLLFISLFFPIAVAKQFDDVSWRASVVRRGAQNLLVHYNDSKLPLPDVDCFPKNFQWGVAVAEFQNSGSEGIPYSNWAHFEMKKGLAPSGRSVDSWNKYQEDIALMKDLNINSLRFSIDWSALEPVQGEWNEDAFTHYDAMLTALSENGITPMVTLHHFTHPAWFDRIGGFEKEENIAYFVRFSEKVFQRFHRKARLWCTINEPGCYAMCGYFLGIHSPGKVCQIKLAGTVLRNLLKGHVAVYKALRALIVAQGLDTENHEIGLVHNVLAFAPRYSLDLISRTIGSIFTGIANDAVISVILSDEFQYDPLKMVAVGSSVVSAAALASSYLMQKASEESITDWAKKHWAVVSGASLSAVAGTVARYLQTAREAFVRFKDSLDFIGLNYYARPVMSLAGTTCFPDQVMGDMDLPISDPAGYNEAINLLAKTGKPIYLTETGCADQFDNRRPLLLRESFYVIAEALKRGVDIRGYYHWTLTDNYEWHNGFGPKFGLADKDRKPRMSAYWLKDFIAQAR